MVHFRWLTPLLLGFAIWMLQDIYRDFKQLKNENSEIKASLSYLRGKLEKQ